MPSACALTLFLSLGTARAEPNQSAAIPRLDWTAPEGCPKAPELLARAQALLAAGKPRAIVATLGVEARVEQLAPEQWALTLTWRHESDPPSTRRVSAKTCDELVDAAALLVALALDPTLPSPEPTAPPDSEELSTDVPEDESASPEPGDAAGHPPERREPAKRAPPTPDPPRDVNGVAEPLRLRAGAGLTVVSGWLPSVTPGLAVVATGSLGCWSVGLELGSFLPRHQALEQASAGGDFRLVRAAVTAAYAIELGTVLVVAPTVGASLNVLYGVGTGSLTSRGGYTTAAAAVTGVRFRRAIASGLSLSAGVDAQFAAARPSFSIGNGGGEVFRPDPLALHAGLAAEVDLR